MNLLAAVPWPWRLAAIASMAAGCVAFGYVKGSAAVQDHWDRTLSTETIAAAKVIVKQGQVTERIVIQYVDRVRYIRETGKAIIKEVPVYVPLDTPDLPAGFRWLHDAAAAGTVPDPAERADAAAVPAQTATTTVVENYTTCNTTREQVIKLQQWIREQQKITSLCSTPVER
ncbi:hypothetical protein HPT27_10640 [Permianibacter sp. IMCC34836]|uniref:hypothetical protein n=1 Tax=Permianibacter fluminis TaxID=2738515 RepID=UPI00155720FA|nr:hypothetical protein [Permianibacter fluminis]NQD37485.1 hypothetical protein [Permianibacter fluminis]